MALELALAYNRLIRPVPHCYPVSAEGFAAAVAATAGGASDEGLRSEAAFVATEGSAMQGFLHVGIGPWHHDDPGEYGLIRFFWYEPGQRLVGRALLSQAEAYLRQRGVDEIVAFSHVHRYPFYYLPSAYLSDRLGHVAALLGMGGYRRMRGEVYMDWLDYTAMEPTPIGVPIDVSLEWRPGRGVRPGLNVHARQGEAHVGICMCVSCGDFAEADEVQDWCFTKWIGIEEGLRSQGLGRYLLQHALLELRGVGYRHAAISTDWHNYPAFLFYTNLGYQVVDWTYAYGCRIGKEEFHRQDTKDRQGGEEGEMGDR